MASHTLRNVFSFRRALAALAACALVLPAIACSEGPAESAGKKLDEAVDSLRGEPSLGEKIDRGLSGGGPGQQAGRDIDEGVEKAKKQAEEAQRQIQDGLEGS